MPRTKDDKRFHTGELKPRRTLTDKIARYNTPAKGGVKKKARRGSKTRKEEDEHNLALFRFVGPRGWSTIGRQNRTDTLKQKWEDTMTQQMLEDAMTISEKHRELKIELRRYLVQGTWDGFWELLALGIEKATSVLGDRRSLFKDAFYATFNLEKDTTEAKCIYSTVFENIDTFYLEAIRDKMHTLEEEELRAYILGKLKLISEHLKTLQDKWDKGLSPDSVNQRLSEEGSKFIMKCLSLTTIYDSLSEEDDDMSFTSEDESPSEEDDDREDA